MNAKHVTNAIPRAPRSGPLKLLPHGPGAGTGLAPPPALAGRLRENPQHRLRQACRQQTDAGPLTSRGRTMAGARVVQPSQLPARRHVLGQGGSVGDVHLGNRQCESLCSCCQGQCGVIPGFSVCKTSFHLNRAGVSCRVLPGKCVSCPWIGARGSVSVPTQVGPLAHVAVTVVGEQPPCPGTVTRTGAQFPPPRGENGDAEYKRVRAEGAGGGENARPCLLAPRCVEASKSSVGK